MNNPEEPKIPHRPTNAKTAAAPSTYGEWFAYEFPVKGSKAVSMDSRNDFLIFSIWDGGWIDYEIIDTDEGISLALVEIENVEPVSVPVMEMEYA